MKYDDIVVLDGQSKEQIHFIKMVLIALRCEPSDMVFLLENSLYVRAEKYLHINLQLLKKAHKDFGYKITGLNFAHKRNGKMEYNFKIERKEMIKDVHTSNLV